MVQPFIRLSEQADSQSLANSHTERLAMEATTPSGIALDDIG
jgi:hypothetical protein